MQKRKFCQGRKAYEQETDIRAICHRTAGRVWATLQVLQDSAYDLASALNLQESVPVFFHMQAMPLPSHVFSHTCKIQKCTIPKILVYKMRKYTHNH